MAAPPAEPPRCEEAYPFADLALRASLDGTTVRVHRGVLATHSRVLRDILLATNDDCLTLPGKCAGDVKLLVAWMYRAEKTTITRVSARGVGAWHVATCRWTYLRPLFVLTEQHRDGARAGARVRHRRHDADRGRLAGECYRYVCHFAVR